jgi:hypothetical protein
MRGTSHFYHKRWYGKMYGLGVFSECIVLDDDLHEEKMQLITHLNEGIHDTS